jgi:hypothetical protein
LTLKASTLEVNVGERVRISGQAMEGSQALGGAHIAIQRRTADGWTTIGGTEAGESGAYATFVWVSAASTLRPVIRDGDRVLVGAQVTIKVGSARRTLALRTEELQDVYGKAGTIHTLSPRQRAKAGLKAGTTVRHRTLGRGALLVEIATPSHAKTWVVKGAIKEFYTRRGGLTGSIGAPTQDPRCGLPSGGCLQTFTHATVYSRHGEAVLSPLRGTRGDIAAVLHSQVGFKQQGSRHGYRVPTPYQKWAGSESAWCSIFLAWGASNAGHDEVIPVHRHFREYVAWLRQDLPRLKTPKPGALVIMNGSEVLGHAAFVASVNTSRRTIRIIDGNWAMRVRETTIPIAPNMEFYWPY